MQVRAIKTRVFKEGESLPDFVASHVTRIPEGSVLVITSKVVALAEGRTARASTNAKKAALIKSESTSTIKTKWVWLTIKDGLVMPNAGVDESNANGKIILLPADSFKAATVIRRTLMKRFKLKELGVLITDSRVLPLRAGVTGVALGYAGFKGLRDYRGKKDIFDRPLRMTQTNVADGLAASAVFLMGEEIGRAHV